MPFTTLTAFGGTALGAATPYNAFVEGGSDIPLGAEFDLLPRAGRGPTHGGMRLAPRDLTFLITQNGAAMTGEAFYAAVAGIFALEEGARLVTAIHDGVAIENTADGVSIALHPRYIGCVQATLRFPEPAWRTTAVSTDSSSPLTVGGNVPALPVITITPSGSTVKRRRITITDTSGRGLAGYPIKITFDSTGAGATVAANYLVMFQGRPVPFLVSNPNNVSTDLLVIADVPPGGSTFLDLYYGSSLSNTVTANALVTGGMDWTAVGWTNANIIWTGFDVNAYPDRTLVWRPARIGAFTGSRRFQVESAGGAMTIRLRDQIAAGGPLRDDYNAVVCVVGSAAAASNAISGLRRTFGAGTYTGAVRGQVLYRPAGQASWTSAWTQDTTVGGISDTNLISVPGAVEIAVVFTTINATALDIDATLVLDTATTFALALDSAATPTASVAAAVTAHLLDSVLTLGTGDTITFDDVLTDGPFDIDCLTMTIIPASGPLYRAAIHPSNRSLWAPLPPGSVAYTDGAGFASSYAFQPRWLL